MHQPQLGPPEDVLPNEADSKRFLQLKRNVERDRNYVTPEEQAAYRELLQHDLCNDEYYKTHPYREKLFYVFLFARKLNIARTLELLEAHVAWRRKYQRFQPQSLRSIEPLMRLGVSYHVPGSAFRDSCGRPIFYLRPAKYFPGDYPPTMFLDHFVWWFEFNLANEPLDFHRLGVVYVQDMQGIGFNNLDGRTEIKATQKELKTAFPVRIRSILVLEPNLFTKLMMALAGLFVKQKVIDRVEKIQRAQLLERIAPDQLLAEFGGRAQFDYAQWVDDLYTADAERRKGLALGLGDDAAAADAASGMQLAEDLRRWTWDPISQFGLPLTDYDTKSRLRPPIAGLWTGYDRPIPSMLHLLGCYFLRNEGYYRQGVFRRQPFERDALEVREDLNKGVGPDRWQDGAMQMDIVANLIKEWFRSLPRPLLNDTARQELPEWFGEVRSPQDAQRMLDVFVEPGRSVLLWLLDLLAVVSQYAVTNLMSAQNLAVAFAQNLYRPPRASMDTKAFDPLRMKKITDMVCCFLEQAIILRLMHLQDNPAFQEMSQRRGRGRSHTAEGAAEARKAAAGVAGLTIAVPEEPAMCLGTPLNAPSELLYEPAADQMVANDGIFSLMSGQKSPSRRPLLSPTASESPSASGGSRRFDLRSERAAGDLAAYLSSDDEDEDADGIDDAAGLGSGSQPICASLGVPSMSFSAGGSRSIHNEAGGVHGPVGLAAVAEESRLESIPGSGHYPSRSGRQESRSGGRSGGYRLPTVSQGAFQVDRNAGPFTSKEDEQRFKRKQVIREIISTEQNYVNALRVMVEGFREPLLNHYVVFEVREDQVKDIFGNVEALLNIHEQLYEELTNGKSLATVILQFAQFMRMYSDFLNQYDDSMAVLSRLSTKSKFQRFITERAEECGQTLPSLLIMPVQRLPRYNLLLRELLKHTPEYHVEYNLIRAAVTTILELTTAVNDSKRELENVSKLVDIQNRIRGKVRLLDHNRRVLREGVLAKVVQEGKSPVKKRYVYVMNDLLLWVSEDRSKFKNFVFLRSALLARMSADRFKLTTKERSPVFQCRNEAECDTYMKLLESTIAEAKQKWLKARQEARQKAEARAMAGVHDAADSPTSAASDSRKRKLLRRFSKRAM